MLKELKLSTSAIELLKWVAIFSMVVDHIHSVVLLDGTAYEWMTYIGRVSFPLFAFIVAYHMLHHVKSKRKYILQLLSLGVVSQPIFAMALPDVEYLNILFTLSLGAGLIYFVEEAFTNRKSTLAFIASITVVLLGIFIPVDYYLGGVLLPLVFWVWLQKPKYIALPAIVVFWINQGLLGVVALITFPIIYTTKALENIPVPRINKWIFYVFYPLHLFVLAMFS